jgi:hypothetical protein
MAKQLWVKIVSWHALRPDDPDVTVCGEEVAEEHEVSDELPAEKSCELCLRILARHHDKEEN